MSAKRLRLFDPATPRGEPPSSTGSSGSSQSPPPSRNPGITAGDVIRRYLLDLSERQASGQITPEHASNYSRSLQASADGRYVGFIQLVREHFAGDRPLGERLVADLVQADLTDWLRANPQWKSNETKRRNVAAVLACFTWAVEEEEMIAASPYTKTKRVKFKSEKRRDATDEEAAKVWENASESLRRIIWFVDVTGCRTKEARELTWSQIDWESSVAVVPNKTRHQTEESHRFVGLDPETLAQLRRWRDEREARPLANQTHVFLTERGATWTKNNLDARFAICRREAGLPDDLTPYCFRHRFGTQSILAGAGQREVADQLGHRGTVTTERYTHTKMKRDHLRMLPANSPTSARPPPPGEWRRSRLEAPARCSKVSNRPLG